VSSCEFRVIDLELFYEIKSYFRYTVTIAPGAYVCEERLQLIGEISIGIDI
jgi:hypothetical protein